MTAKRFILDDDGIIVDMVDLSIYMDNEDCCEKLNELNDEKKELQFQFNLLREQRNEFHRRAIENANRVDKLEKENNELKEELKIYRKIASCSNCDYLDYDWFDDGDEFEICEKGNNEQQMDYHICEDWREL